MKYTIEGQFEPRWEDTINCICWLENMHSRGFHLSKRKLLRYLSNLQTFEPFHIMLLDNLSTTFSYVYYMEDSDFILSKTDMRICAKVPAEEFENIIINCSVHDT